MRIEITTTLSVIVTLVLFNSYSALRYVTLNNQVYAQPGDRVTIEVKTDLISVKGLWPSYYGHPADDSPR